jgi:hypothetical protein
MTQVADETLFQRVDLPGSRIQDEMVFFHQDAGKYYAVGPVGAEIWDFLATPRSFDAICEHLLTRFDVDQSTCEAQVRRFLDELASAKMIELLAN